MVQNPKRMNCATDLTMRKQSLKRPATDHAPAHASERGRYRKNFGTYPVLLFLGFGVFIKESLKITKDTYSVPAEPTRAFEKTENTKITKEIPRFKLRRAATLAFLARTPTRKRFPHSTVCECLKAFFRHASVCKTHRHAVYHCLKEVHKPISTR